MEIGTNYDVTSLLASATALGGSRPTSTSSSASSFGPPAQVSINDNAPTVTGFTDYAQLGLSGLWQFDLASVLNPTVTGVPQAARSEEEQKADEAAVQTAFDYINQGQFDAARQLMNGLLSENKTNAAATYTLGYADMEEGKYASAEQLFLKAHAFDPTVGYDQDAENARILQRGDESVLASARGMLADSNRHADGLRILINLSGRSPNNTAAHLLLGDSMLDAGDGTNGLMQYNAAVSHARPDELGQVEQHLQELARSAPTSAFLQQLVGKAQLRQEHFDDAVQTLTHAAELADNEASYRAVLAQGYVGLGRQLLERGDVNGARADFAQAKTLDPTGRDTKQALAEGYVARAARSVAAHNYSSAVADYSLIASLLEKSTDTALRERAAAGAYAAGRAVQASRIAAGEEIDGEVAAFQAAYDLDPDNTTYKHKLADTRNALGDQFFATGDYEEAAGAYLRAHTLFKYDKTYRTNATKAFVAYGDERLYNLNYDDAVEAYRQAYRVDTTSVESRQKLATALTARGLDYKSQEKYAKAVLDLKEALRLFPDNAAYQANYDSVSPWDT
jgi:tetratricopeptide (TPR) repeat protein